MSGYEVWSFAVAAVLVVIAGLLTAAQAAFGSISAVRAGELVREERPGAARLGAMIADAGKSFTGLLFARSVAEIVATVLVAAQLDRHLSAEWAAVLIAAVVMVVITFPLVTIGARAIGTGRAESIALRAAGPARLLVALLGPLPRVVLALASRLAPLRPPDERFSTSEAELRHLVDEASQRRVIESGEQRMIQSVFDFGDTIVREVMVPRTDMVWIERSKTVRQALNLALRSGFSRIPVVGGGEDDVVGVAYIKDLVRRAIDAEAGSRDRLEDSMRPAYFVPESKPVDDLLREMQSSQVHLAVVIDEYGGTAGLVTIEDILEEIVGEIVDEHDREKPRIEAVGEDSMRVNVRVPIDDVEELFGVHFDVDDVETVGGLMASALGRVPIPGTTVNTCGLRLTAEGGIGRRHRVSTVLIERPAPTESAAGNSG